MKILDTSHQVFDLGAFNKVDHSKDRVEVQGNLVTAGKSWKGRLVSALETFGIFKDYCADFRKQESSNNTQAAWELFGGLKEKYGTDTVDAALESTKGRFKGMDQVRENRGITTGGNEVAEPLTCGEVRALMDESAAIAKYQQLHPKPETREMGTQTDAPDVHEMEVQTDPVKGLKPLSKLLHPQPKKKSVETATTTTSTGTDAPVPESTTEEASVAATPRKAGHVTNTIANHTLAKKFVQDKSNLESLLTAMGKDPKALSSSHAEYVTSRVLLEVSQLSPEMKLAETDLKDMVRTALKDSIEHNAAWNRFESVKIGTEKRHHKADSGFKADLKALVSEVKAQAKSTITLDFVTKTAGDAGVTLNKYQTKYTMDESIDRAVRTARSERIELDAVDFKEIVKIVAAEAEGKSRARLITGL